MFSAQQHENWLPDKCDCMPLNWLNTCIFPLSAITERLSSFHGRLPPDKVKEYITAAFEGDLEKVKAFVTNNPAKVSEGLNIRQLKKQWRSIALLEISQISYAGRE